MYLFFFTFNICNYCPRYYDKTLFTKIQQKNELINKLIFDL